MRLRPFFVDVLPDFDAIKAGELWISHRYRTVNLRCPLRLWRSDRPVSPPKSVARSFRWQVGLSGRSYGWVRVGQFRLRQPLLHKEQRRHLGT